MANVYVIGRLEYRANEASKVINKLFEQLTEINVSKYKTVSGACNLLSEELKDLEFKNKQLKQDIIVQKNILIPDEEKSEIPQGALDLSGIFRSKLTSYFAIIT